MSDRSDISIKKQYKSLYKEIFGELTSHYDNSDPLIDDNMVQRSDVLHDISKHVIMIIQRNYNIVIQLIIEDFKAEIKRLKFSGIELNDIPTYQLSFALEEGSWILFLRDRYPKTLYHIFDRIIILEELLWESGKGQIEDYAFYLLEMKQLSDKYVTNVFNDWKSEHMDGTYENITKRMIAAVYNVSINHAEILLEGSIRVLESKLKDLGKILKLKSMSPRINDAKKIYLQLKEEIENKQYSRSTLSFLVILAIFQKEIIRYKQELKKKNTRSLNENRVNTAISKILNWDELDPLEIDSVNNFKEIILTMLYDQTEEDPMLASIHLLKDVFTGLGVKKTVRDDLFKKFKSQISMRVDSINDEEIILRKKVELIQLFLPNMLIKLKSNKGAFDKMTFDEKEILNNEFWDSFEDNLKRGKRIHNELQSQKIIKKAILNAYKFMLNHRVPIERSYIQIIDKFEDGFPQFKEELTILRLEMSNIFENIKLETTDKTVIDKIITDKLIEEIYSLIKKK